MISIQTRFIGPTDKRGSRIVAETMEPEARRLYMECQDALGIEENHKQAARLLIQREGWDTEHYQPWHFGGTVRGYSFVCAAGDWTKLDTTQK